MPVRLDLESYTVREGKNKSPICDSYSLLSDCDRQTSLAVLSEAVRDCRRAHPLVTRPCAIEI